MTFMVIPAIYIILKWDLLRTPTDTIYMYVVMVMGNNTHTIWYKYTIIIFQYILL